MGLFYKQYVPRGEVDKETLKKKVFNYCCLEIYDGKEYNVYDGTCDDAP